MSKDLSSNKLSHKAKRVTDTKVTTSKLTTIQMSLRVVSVVLLCLAFFFGGQFIGAILFFGLLAIFGKTGDEATRVYTDNTALQLGLLCVIAIATSLAILKFLKWRKVSIRSFLLLRNRPTPSVIFGLIPVYFVYFACLIAATILVGMFTSVDVNQAQDLGIEDPKSIIDKLILFTMLVIVTPVYEEFLFRGFLYNYLRKFGTIAVSAITTSVLFGIAHLEYENLNWIAAVDTFIFSMFLIYVSQKYKSLFAAIIFHAAKNAIAFYVLFVH